MIEAQLVSAKKTIGGYEYWQSMVIGRGSNSIAYQGKKSDSSERVCIKHIDLRNPTIQKLAKSEIAILQRLSHQNIVKLLGSFECERSIFIVTEYCEATLQQKLRGGRLQEKQALELFLSILEGYQELRNNGFIHRDIKPENILIQNGTPKLADFGFGVPLTSTCIRSTLNVGTPLYMAPEVLLHNSYSQKSDIWSLGITFYEMLFGKTPFTSLSEQALRRQLRKPIRFGLSGNKASKRIIERSLCHDVQGRCDLQHLVFQVKVALHGLDQLSRQQQVNENYQIRKTHLMNQVNYIRFLEYVKFLAKEAHSLDLQTRSRILALLEYSIRVRLVEVERCTQKDSTELLPETLGESLRELSLQHSLPLERPEGLGPNDRLRWLVEERPVYRKSIHWQIQTELKTIITEILKSVGRKLSEYQVAVNEAKVKLVDFLISAFLLNAMLISQQNDGYQFARLSNLELILCSPSRITLKVWQNIREKAVKLGLS